MGRQLHARRREAARTTTTTGRSSSPTSASRDLHQHLIWQLEISPLDPRQVWIGEAIVDALNDDGYLTETLAEIAQSLTTDLPVTVDEMSSEVLAFVQTLDPAGIGARSVSECIALQLAQLEPETPGRDLARQHRTRTPAGRRRPRRDRAAARARTSDEDALQEALALIRGCHPRPGSAFESAQPEYIVPGRVRAPDRPGLVRRDQLRLGARGCGSTRATPASWRAPPTTRRCAAQLQEARWLIRSLEIRNETLLKVARTIVQRQAAFLERGDEAMEPMILRDVAEAVSMHESTISRVTTGKYMHTPRGIFEFRYFFSSHVVGRRRRGRLVGRDPRAHPPPDRRRGTRQAAQRRAARGAARDGRRQGGAAHRGEVPRIARARLIERAAAGSSRAQA